MIHLVLYMALKIKITEMKSHTNPIFDAIFFGSSLVDRMTNKQIERPVKNMTYCINGLSDPLGEKLAVSFPNDRAAKQLDININQESNTFLLSHPIICPDLIAYRKRSRGLLNFLSSHSLLLIRSQYMANIKRSAKTHKACHVEISRL